MGFEDPIKISEEEKRAIEMSRLIKSAEKIIEEQKKEGQGKIGRNIEETFKSGKIEKVTADRYFYLILAQKEGSLIVVSDLHGDIEALEKAAEFLEDKNNHLISLGDNIVSDFENKRNIDQTKTLEFLLELFVKYPDRVHLGRGNCEVDIAPVGGFGLDIYGKQGLRGFNENIGRMKRLFNKMPLGFVAENGAAGLHGLLPRGVYERGKVHYRNLQEVNSFSDYGDESKFSGREVKRMLWGEIDENSNDEFRKGKEGMVSGREGVLKSMDAIGASVFLRGHQHSLAKRKGGAFSIDFDGRVGTFVSHRQENDRRIVIIPLNKKINKLTEDYFVKV